jgi:glycerophosphoryl diester phosphodiesterase
MRKWVSCTTTALAFGFLTLTFLNASWLAPMPVGKVQLLAQDGVHQWFDRATLEPGVCSAAHIEVPVAETADGQFVGFGDEALDCRTNGKGPVGEHSLAQFKELDVGYGYTADGGEAFPFRGKGRGEILTLAELVDTAQGKPRLYRLAGDDPEMADRFAAKLKETNRNVTARGDGFLAPPALQAQFPRAWSFSEEGAQACTSGYVTSGRFAIAPGACHNSTLVIPLDQQWAFAGWPNRLIARMDAVGARIVVLAREDEHGRATGIDLLLIDDLWTIGPTLHPDLDRRSFEKAEIHDLALKRRRDRRM